MELERLRTQLNLLPFRPFVVETSSGKRVPVQHPDYVMLSPGGTTLVVFYRDKPDGEKFDDGSMEIIDVPLITSLSIQGGGKPARRR